MDADEFLIRVAALKAYAEKAAEMRRDLEKNAPDLSEATAALLPDSTPVATVTYREGYDRARVTDAKAFTDYVMEHYPDQIEVSVSADFTKHLLDLALHEDIPGTDVSSVKGSHNVRLLPDAYEMIWLHRAESDDFAAVVDLP